MALVVIFCGALFFSCSPEQKSANHESLAALLAHGKKQLEQNHGRRAADDFHHALNLDADNTDAQYGLLLANVMQFANFIDQIVTTINGLNFQNVPYPGNTPATADQESGDGAAIFYDSIHGYLREKIVPQITENESLYASLASAPDLQFDLDAYALQINQQALLAFGGEFDQTDLHFFGAVNALLHGLLQFILAYDLRFDFTKLQLPKIEAGAPLTDTIDAIVKLLDALLSSEKFPTFLRLMPDTGPADLEAAGVDFGDAFARLTLAFSAMARSGPRPDDQFGYRDLDFDGRYDGATEPVFIGRTVTIDPQLALALWDLSAVLSAAFYEGTPFDIDPTHLDLLRLSDLDYLLAALHVLPISLGSLQIDELPSWIGLNVGAFFSDPQPDELRNILELVINIWQAIEPQNE
jgi:hypothetical protein